MPTSSRFEENHTELVRGGDVDLGGRCYYGYTADHLDGISAVGHLYLPSARRSCLGNQAGPRGMCEAGGSPEYRTGWLVKCHTTLLIVTATV